MPDYEMTVEVNENLRVAVARDDWQYTADDILGELDGGGVYFLPKRDYGRFDFYLDRYSLGDLKKTLNNYFRQLLEFHDYGKATEAIIKHLKRQGYDAKLVTLNSYGEFCEVIIYGKAEWLEGIECDLAKWWNGEVFTLILERAEVWSNTNGDTKTEWEVSDSLGCVLFEGWSETEVLERAREYFGELI